MVPQVFPNDAKKATNASLLDTETVGPIQCPGCQQMQSQLQALAGAIQTCDYFINKIESPPEDDGDIEEES